MKINSNSNSSNNTKLQTINIISITDIKGHKTVTEHRGQVGLYMFPMVETWPFTTNQ